MATSALPTATLRVARCYAPDAVAKVLREIATAPTLGVILDVDALERSALARVDRVMLLALDTLAQTGAHILLAARDHQQRARMVSRSLEAPAVIFDAGSNTLFDAHSALPMGRLVVISDNPALLTMITTEDRALALGRPELAGPLISVIGDSSVRASLWCLAHERQRIIRGP